MMPSWMRTLVLSLAIGCLAQATVALGQVPEQFNANEAERNSGIQGTEVATLQEQLMNGLRVVTPEQRSYVNQVVDLVDQGHLPRAMVNAIYKWSLQRNPSVPFPYFQIALRALASRRGISVP